MVQMVILYKWSRPNEVMDTQYGRITVSEWLRREKYRITDDPTRQAVIANKGNLCTLMVDKPSDLRRR